MPLYRVTGELLTVRVIDRKRVVFYVPVKMTLLAADEESAVAWILSEKARGTIFCQWIEQPEVMRVEEA